MGLELRRGRDGVRLPYWYGRYTDENGKVHVVGLSVAVVGTEPPTLRDKGDTEFEVSRALAEDKLKDHQLSSRLKGQAQHLTSRLIAAKTGRAVEYVKLADLPAKWRAIGRESKPTDARLKWCDTIFGRFAEAVPCKYLHEVTPEQVAAYIETLRATLSRSTVTGTVQLLKSAFARLLPLGTSNPFMGGITRRGMDAGCDVVHRKPLTAPELSVLFETARSDPFLYPLTVCAALTGMRIGDVCQLTWQSVDLRDDVIAVRTSKTGRGVEIPIFKPLREVFETAVAEREQDAVYVWPAAARMYKENRQGVTYRGKVLFARAFASKAPAVPDVTPLPERVDLAAALPQLLKAVEGRYDGKKRDRILDTVTRYANGQSYRQIEVETGRHRGQTSEDLRDAGTAAGLNLRHGALVATKRDIKTLIGETRQKRRKGKGRLAASILGWHSLRGTWATLALSAGIPVETVKLVTGHSTVNTILKFYYNPQREHLRAVLDDKLPGILTGREDQVKIKHTSTRSALSDADPVAQVADQLKNMSKSDRVRLAKMLEEM
ncbi:MAG TPA: site-specific integrase [Kiritimatiellia bacterium]|nr:site-specific integrase [Kiritimatiellia bacterium]